MVCTWNSFEHENDFETLDLGIQNESNVTCEYLILKLNISLARNSRKTIIIGGLYRSPSAKPDESFEKIEQILSKLDKHKNKQIILAGDLNFDLVQYQTDKNSQTLLDMTTRHNFVQVISKPQE